MIETEIEQLLAWVYREELPKRGSDTTWANMFSSETWRLGTRVDQSSSGEFAPVGAGTPHPDALLIDHAIRSMPHVTLVWEHVVDEIMGPFAEVLRHDPALRRIEFSPPGLLIVHAQINHRPAWDVGQIRVKHFGQQPQVWWVDEHGERTMPGSKRAGYYSPGAVCPIEYDPKLTTVAEARAEYYVWRRCLDSAVDLLSTLNLVETKAAPPAAPLCPWFTGEEAKPNVLKDLSNIRNTVNQPRPTPLFPRRNLTTLPQSKPVHGPVRRLPIPGKSDIP